MKNTLVALMVICFSATLQGGRYTSAVERIPDEYLVLLKTSVKRNELPTVASSLSNQHGGRVIAVMQNVGNLFAVRLTESQARRLADNPLVEFVEEAAVVHLSSQQTFHPFESLEDPNVNPRTPGLSKWHLDRIDQSSPAPVGVYNYCEKAADVYAYIPDTGVWRDHVEFANNPSRIKEGVAKDAEEGIVPANEPCQGAPAINRNDDQPYGHGTAVASVLGGQYVGVAKNVNIVPLRNFACDNALNESDPNPSTVRLAWTLSWIKGWRCSDPLLPPGHSCGSPAGPEDGNPFRGNNRYGDRSLNKPMLLSMSQYVNVTDPYVGAIESVINSLLQDDPADDWKGITVIASANNQATSNNQTSPARMAYRNQPYFNTSISRRVISVGGTGQKYIFTNHWELHDYRWACPMYRAGDVVGFSYGSPIYAAVDEPCWVDGRLYGSNYGRTVDIYAPAHNISTASLRGTNEYRNIYEARSGTSFAAPIVAGLAARILEQSPGLTPEQVWTSIRDQAWQAPAGFYFDTVPINSGIPYVNANPAGNNLLAKRIGYASCTPEYP
ncbi:MAG: S8 family serine peptidase [Acidobacteriota bacterium]